MYQKRKPKIIKDLIWIDIETVPLRDKEEDADKWIMKVFENRYSKDKPQDQNLFDYFFERAWLFAEFSKVVCISFWKVTSDWIKVWSIVWENELDVLTRFNTLLSNPKMYYTNNTFAWFNIKNFDCPFLAKRMVINWLPRRKHLMQEWKKPRDVDFVDVMDLRAMWWWQYAWLETIACLLWLPNPKEDLDWKEVKNLFYSNDPEKLEKIKNYCEKDVKVAYSVYKKINDTRTE